mmetsp:Transcript_7727/g.15077  ORF Transcript_7727/g.15077 Transcript_7727/m.15077 type:complete len:222 (+) Transcript_7727:1305-1970(+)
MITVREQVGAQRRMDAAASEDELWEFVKRKAEARDNPEVAITAAYSPEKLRVLLFVRQEDISFSGNDFHLVQVVNRHAKGSFEDAVSPTQSVAAHACGRQKRAGDGEVVRFRCLDNVTPSRTAFDVHPLRDSVDIDRFHPREVNGESAGDHTQMRVPTAGHAYRDVVLCTMLSVILEGRSDFLGAGAGCDSNRLAEGVEVHCLCGVEAKSSPVVNLAVEVA